MSTPCSLTCPGRQERRIGTRFRQANGAILLCMDKRLGVKISTARKIRVAPDCVETGWSIVAEDWKVRIEHRHMIHMPSRLTFVVNLDDDAAAKPSRTLWDYYAEPLRLPGDERLYDPEQLQELGAVAVILFLIADGKVTPEFS